MTAKDAGSLDITAAELRSLLELQQEAARRDGILSCGARRDALERLAEALVARKEEIAGAIDGDFGGRSRHETLLAEVFTSVAAARFAAEHVEEWTRPRGRRVSLAYGYGRARVVYQPYGVVGILAPWNYPLYLSVAPLVGALAAGNRAMVKPSPACPRIADLLAEIITDLFPAEYVAVCQGPDEMGPLFSALPFDYMLFTGSAGVGRRVMRAAADNLCPVTLELGGKSPALIAEDYSLERAATSVISGKLFNGGQTCVAPDYALVAHDKMAAFVEVARRTATRLYPRIGDNPDYTAIVDQRQHDRLRGLLDDARQKGARVIEINPAGESPEALGRKLPPTLLLDTTAEMRVMREEIFGPLLPIVPYRDLDEALELINARPRPLALYLFSDRRGTVDRVIGETMSGGVCVNETLIQVGQEDLPFGGVGESGMGQYHGHEGFVTFSKARAIYEQSRASTMPFVRPPYGRLIERVLGFLLRS